MLHLAQFKPQIPRTKRFEIAYTRNKSVTSNFISTSTPPRTMTKSISQNLKRSSARNSANRVGVMSKYFDTPNRTNRAFSEQNTQFTTRPCRNTSTSNLYSRIGRTLCPRLPNLCPLCSYVRVLSEYSDIRDTKYLKSLERNTQIRVWEYPNTHFFFLPRVNARHKQQRDDEL
jgi:hypothetical protein